MLSSNITQCSSSHGMPYLESFHARESILNLCPILSVLLKPSAETLHVLHECLHVAVVAGRGHDAAVHPTVHCRVLRAHSVWIRHSALVELVDLVIALG